MNIKIHVFSLIICSSALYTSVPVQSHQSVSPPGTTILNLHINTANKAGLTQTNRLGQQADHFSSQKTDTKVDSTLHESDKNIKQQLYDFYQEQSKFMQESSTNIITLVWQNKLKTIGIVILLSYGYISYKIYQAHLIINDPNSWSNWHNGNSLNNLFETPQARLEADLLFAIQTRYVHPTNPTDFIYSIVQASNSLQQELKILDEQIARYKFVQKSHCTQLFFIKDEEIEELQDKHKKLLFLKYILSSWCASYKIDKNS